MTELGVESLVLRFKASRIPSLAGGGPRNTMELPLVLPGWLRMWQTLTVCGKVRSDLDFQTGAIYLA